MINAASTPSLSYPVKVPAAGGSREKVGEAGGEAAIVRLSAATLVSNTPVL